VDRGFDCIVTMTDRLRGADVRILPTKMSISAEDFAALFFEHWYCENGIPLDIISDQDKLFVSKFWKVLHELTGIDIKMSTAYHPESDGVRERTNKTVVQMLCYHVERNQKVWVKALPKIRFQLMNTVNASTGYSGFQLRMGRSAHVIPPLVPTRLSDHTKDTSEGMLAINFLAELETDVAHAKDCLLQAKLAQSVSANSKRSNEDAYAVGDLVLLSTKNHRNEYKKKNEKRVAKFFPRFDGPFRVVKSNPESSTYSTVLTCQTMARYTRRSIALNSSASWKTMRRYSAPASTHAPAPSSPLTASKNFSLTKLSTRENVARECDIWSAGLGTARNTTHGSLQASSKTVRLSMCG
jgi:hypothetical protein